MFFFICAVQSKLWAINFGYENLCIADVHPYGTTHIDCLPNKICKSSDQTEYNALSGYECIEKATFRDDVEGLDYFNATSFLVKQLVKNTSIDHDLFAFSYPHDMDYHIRAKFWTVLKNLNIKFDASMPDNYVSVPEMRELMVYTDNASNETSLYFWKNEIKNEKLVSTLVSPDTIDEDIQEVLGEFPFYQNSTINYTVNLMQKIAYKQLNNFGVDIKIPAQYSIVIENNTIIKKSDVYDVTALAFPIPALINNTVKIPELNYSQTIEQICDKVLHLHDTSLHNCTSGTITLQFGQSKFGNPEIIDIKIEGRFIKHTSMSKQLQNAFAAKGNPVPETNNTEEFLSFSEFGHTLLLGGKYFKNQKSEKNHSQTNTCKIFTEMLNNYKFLVEEDYEIAAITNESTREKWMNEINQINNSEHSCNISLLENLSTIKTIREDSIKASMLISKLNQAAIELESQCQKSSKCVGENKLIANAILDQTDRMIREFNEMNSTEITAQDIEKQKGYVDEILQKIKESNTITINFKNGMISGDHPNIELLRQLGLIIKTPAEIEKENQEKERKKKEQLDQLMNQALQMFNKSMIELAMSRNTTNTTEIIEHMQKHLEYSNEARRLQEMYANEIAKQKNEKPQPELPQILFGGEPVIKMKPKHDPPPEIPPELADEMPEYGYTPPPPEKPSSQENSTSSSQEKLPNENSTSSTENSTIISNSTSSEENSTNSTSSTNSSSSENPSIENSSSSTENSTSNDKTKESENSASSDENVKEDIGSAKPSIEELIRQRNEMLGSLSPDEIHAELQRRKQEFDEMVKKQLNEQKDETKEEQEPIDTEAKQENEEEKQEKNDNKEEARNSNDET